MSEELKEGDLVRFTRTHEGVVPANGRKVSVPAGTAGVVHHNFKHFLHLTCVGVPEARIRHLIVKSDVLERLPAPMWR